MPPNSFEGGAGASGVYREVAEVGWVTWSEGFYGVELLPINLCTQFTIHVLHTNTKNRRDGGDVWCYVWCYVH